MEIFYYNIHSEDVRDVNCGLQIVLGICNSTKKNILFS